MNGCGLNEANAQATPGVIFKPRKHTAKWKLVSAGPQLKEHEISASLGYNRLPLDKNDEPVLSRNGSCRPRRPYRSYTYMGSAAGNSPALAPIYR